MPKGRHLKPDFFTDKNIVSMQPLARLLYEGLWCYAADCGHLDDEPIELKMRILPADSCDIDELLEEVANHGRIVRENGVIYLPKLSDHARVDKRYETKCEACKDAENHAVTTPGNTPPSTPDTTGSRSDHDGDTTGTQRDHDADGDGDGDGEVMVRGKSGRKRPATRLPDDWTPTEKHWERRHDAIDVEKEAEKFRLHAEANDRRQVNWNAAFSQWLMNARPSTTPTAQGPRLVSVHDLATPPPGLSDEEYLQWDFEQRQKRGQR